MHTTHSFILSITLVVGLAFTTCALADPVCDALPAPLVGKSLTLVELSDIALSCNPTTRVGWAEIKDAFATLGINKSAYWPQLGATLDRTSSQDTFQQSTNSTNGKRQLTYGPGASLQYVIWDFGVRTEQIKTAVFQLQAAKLMQNATFQQIILQVEEAYYQVVGQKALLDANSENVIASKANLSAAQALHREGMATIGDVYQAESALSQAELTRIATEGALKIAEGQLALAMGYPMQMSIRLAKLSDKIETTLISQSLSELLTIAKENRPDLVAAETQVKAADASLVAISRQAWPSLTLNANTQRTYSKNATLNGRTNSVGLGIRIPIFSGFAQKYALMQAQAQKEQLAAQRDALAQKIDFQVWQAYFDVQTAAKSMASSQKLLKSSVQAAKQAHGQYQSGVGNILNVLTTQATAASASAQLVQTKINWYMALAEFSAALGKLNGALGKVSTQHEIQGL